jgi:hypothetical protein
LPDNLERFLFSEDRLMLMATLRGEFAGRRQIDFQDLADRDFVGLTSSTAVCTENLSSGVVVVKSAKDGV